MEDITKHNSRYDPGAIKFVHEGLGVTIRHITEQADSSSAEPWPAAGGETEEIEDQGQSRHVTGRELAEGLRDLALARWGRLAKVVLERWGVKTTRDFGEIVYLMIKHHWMTSQTSDRIEDFDDIYDFKTAFEDQFKFELPDQIA